MISNFCNSLCWKTPDNKTKYCFLFQIKILTAHLHNPFKLEKHWSYCELWSLWNVRRPKEIFSFVTLKIDRSLTRICFWLKRHNDDNWYHRHCVNKTNITDALRAHGYVRIKHQHYTTILYGHIYCEGSGFLSNTMRRKHFMVIHIKCHVNRKRSINRFPINTPAMPQLHEAATVRFCGLQFIDSIFTNSTAVSLLIMLRRMLGNRRSWESWYEVP